jgi:uncharacterized membrane protein YhaH (DUF805 family)
MRNLSPIDWAVRPLKRYADFDGRAARAEYWWFVFFQWLALIVLVIGAVTLSGGFSSGGSEPQPFFWVLIVPVALAIIALFIPNVAVQVRRLHDQNVTGWLVLIFFIPYIGGLIALIFMCISGTSGPNRFGPDPYEEDHLGEIFA